MKDEMSGTCSTHGGDEKLYKILFAKFERNRRRGNIVTD